MTLLATFLIVGTIGACGNSSRASDEGSREPKGSTFRVASVTSEQATPDVSQLYMKAFRGAGGAMASVRDRAHATLEEYGSAANAAAEQALTSNQRTLRLGAAAHLARHGTASSATPLLAAMDRGQRGGALRSQIVVALGHVATTESLGALVALVEGSDSREAFLAARQLADVGTAFPRERLRTIAGMGNPAHMRAGALMALGPRAEPDEADIFRAGAVDFAPPIRACAAAGLARLPDVTRDEMNALVTDEDGGVRLAALTALHAVDADWVAAIAGPSLHDHEDDIQSAAVQAIAARPDSGSYEVLLAILTNEEQEAHVRGAAARGLLSIDPTRGVAAVEMVASAESGGAGLYCRDALEQLPHADR